MTSAPAVRRVGRYEVVREVGRGGTAVVYLARQTDLDRNVALKELSAFRAGDPSFVERFLRESRLTGSLNHPNIVTVYEYFQHEGAPFIAMEYFERGSLRPLVGALTLAQIAGILEGVLAGLAYAEKHGVVHRDLKPENVMIASAGTIKISDFGMAKAWELEAGRVLTESGTTVGTPAYMAPEQALGKDVGPKADLYSVGVIAYELLAGRVPFDQAEPPMAIMLRHLNDPVPPLLSERPDLDPRLTRFVERLLAKEPSRRPSGAANAWEELEEIGIAVLGPRWRRQARLPSSAVAPSPRADAPTFETKAAWTPKPWARERRTWAAAVAGVILLGAGGAVAATALSGGSNAQTARTTTSTGTKTTGPPTRIAGPAVSDVASIENATTLRATLRLAGQELAPGHVIVRDAAIRDGKATFLLRQKGMVTRTPGGTFGPVRLRLRRAPGLVRVDVLAASGRFDGARVRRVDGHTVVLTLTKRQQPSRGSTTVVTSRTTTSPPPTRPRTTTTTTATTTTTRPIIEGG
ncbi:MAG TPA: serine/threonine-protein kinase [Gaiellaceae bacterium]|nr:serine/threonine-protein kinase [Gaiellaceae bacterium]